MKNLLIKDYSFWKIIILGLILSIFSVPSYGHHKKYKLGFFVPHSKNNKFWKGSWVVTVYNVYARKNAYSIFFESKNGVTQANKLSILGTILPSITYNFKF